MELLLKTFIKYESFKKALTYNLTVGFLLKLCIKYLKFNLINDFINNFIKK